MSSKLPSGNDVQGLAAGKISGGELSARFVEVVQHHACCWKRVCPSRYALSPDRHVRGSWRLLDCAGSLPVKDSGIAFEPKLIDATVAKELSLNVGPVFSLIKDKGLESSSEAVSVF